MKQCLILCAAALLAACSAEPIIKEGNQPTTTRIEYREYALPVVCHVIYQNASADSLARVSARIRAIINKVNTLYKDNETGVQFVLTNSVPTGKKVDEPGIEYIRRTEAEFDPDKVMDNNSSFKQYVWDPNRYINLLFYPFAKENGEYITLGISHMPLGYTDGTTPEGLQEVSKSTYPSMTLDNVEWGPCCSINSLYISEESSTENYNIYDSSVTTAHELGHYLGLFHAFTERNSAESSENLLDSCGNTDYCKDTPDYNRAEYEYWLENYMNQHQGKTINMREVVKRQNCQNQQFNSHNIMDYSVSYTDQFTTEQKDRMQKVLRYSPLMPRENGATRAEVLTRKVLRMKAPVIREPAHRLPLTKLKK